MFDECIDRVHVAVVDDEWFVREAGRNAGTPGQMPRYSGPLDVEDTVTIHREAKALDPELVGGYLCGRGRRRESDERERRHGPRHHHDLS